LPIGRAVSGGATDNIKKPAGAIRRVFLLNGLDERLSRLWLRDQARP
jgi:hypothetical protein